MASGMSTEDLIRVIDEFSEIPAGHAQPEWSETFRMKSRALGGILTDSENRGIYKELLECFRGGAGSLNDMVLYRNGKLLKEQTSRFHFLLEHIRDAAHTGLATPGGTSDRGLLRWPG